MRLSEHARKRGARIQLKSFIEAKAQPPDWHGIVPVNNGEARLARNRNFATGQIESSSAISIRPWALCQNSRHHHPRHLRIKPANDVGANDEVGRIASTPPVWDNTAYRVWARG
jgi:hypothetical protein